MALRPLIASLALGVFFFSCGDNADYSTQDTQAASETDTLKRSESSFEKDIGIAHGDENWDARKAVEGNITVVFNGNERLKGRMIAETSIGRVRIETEDSLLLVWDGEKAWLSPDTSSFQGARFHLKTWPYFLAAPMKLDDPGTMWQTIGDAPLMGKNYNRKKLTFKSGTGDSPDDWYVVYKDPDSDKLKAMAYIVTYGNTVDKASEAPHIIVYDEYEEVDGTMLSTEWKFYNWSEENGLEGDSIGYVTLSDLKFSDISDSLFQAPAAAKEDKMPSQTRL